MALQVTHTHSQDAANYPDVYEGGETMRTDSAEKISRQDAAWRGVREPVLRRVLDTVVSTWNAAVYDARIIGDAIVSRIERDDVEADNSSEK